MAVGLCRSGRLRQVSTVSPAAPSGGELEVPSDAAGGLCRCESAVIEAEVLVWVDEVAAGAQLVRGI